MPWYWPDFVYNYFGEGREHNRSLKILHSFTDSVSITADTVSAVFLYTCSLSLVCHLKCAPIGCVCFPVTQVIHERADYLSYIESDSESDQGMKKRRAFLDMLLKTTDEKGKKLTHKDIQEEVDTFMFEVIDQVVSIIVG